MKNIFFILIILIVAFSSCVDDLEKDNLLSKEPMLVINCLVTANDSVRISLSESNEKGSWYYEIVKDATVHLYVNDKLTESINFIDKEYKGDNFDDYTGEYYIKGGYFSSYIAKHGDKIKIHAESPKHGDVWSKEVVVPEKIELASSKLVKNETVDSYNGEYKIFYHNISFTFEDNPDILNFYLLETKVFLIINDTIQSYSNNYNTVNRENKYQLDECIYINNQEVLGKDIPHPSLEVGYSSNNLYYERINYNYGDFFLFSNKKFVDINQEIDLVIKRYRYNSSWKPTEPGEKYQARVYLSRVSPEYYHYLKSIQRIEENSYDINIPSQVYGNIINGAGVVAAKAETVIPFDIEVVKTLP